ncbi:MAG: hypothetical protein A2V93_00270 [Ignavibacteria bacterium RBG_16_34_14]|nr:MAG: hypothetical protein A2V93_00270 [Ignavibacteria bacterium RBG_16_34_14]
MNEKTTKKQLVRDPVCGMWIEPKDAADETLYKDKIFYFCAPGCKKEFQKNPEQYFSNKLNEETDNGHSNQN